MKRRSAEEPSLGADTAAWACIRERAIRHPLQVSIALSMISAISVAVFETARALLFPVAQVRCVTDALLLLLAISAAATLFGALWGVTQRVFLSLVRLLGDAAARVPVFGRRRGFARPLCASLLLSPLCLRFVQLLFGGRRISRIPHHAIFVAAASLLAVLALVLASWAVASVAGRIAREEVGARGRRALVAVLLAAAFCLQYVDATCYVGLYRYVHGALSAACFLAVQGAWAVTVSGRRQGVRPLLSTKQAVAALCCAAAVLVFLPRVAWTRGAWNRTLHAIQSSTTSAAQLFRLRGLFAGAPAYQPTGLPAETPFWMLDPEMSVLKDKPGLPGVARGMNLVVVTVDALRADHLGCYGYPRPVSPSIDRMAREGIVFHNAYAPAPSSFFSILGLMTSRYGSSFILGMRADDPPTLAEILGAQGYATGGFFSPLLLFMQNKDNPLERTGLGFAVRQDAGAKSEDASFVYSTLSRFIRAHRSQPFFAWAHFLERHYPFVPHEGHDFGPSPVDRYDGEIAYVDRFIGRLVSDLAREGLWDRTVFCVTADHGEGMGEHGSLYHGGTLYEEETHVACVLRIPGVRARVVDAPVQTIDLAPTLLSLLGLPRGPFMQGTDLGPLIAGDAPGFRGTAFSEAIGERIAKRMVRRDRWKLIHDMASTAYELYDLANDPKETRNLYGEEAETAAVLRELMGKWAAHQFENTRILSLRGGGGGDEVDRLIAHGAAGDIESLRRLLPHIGSESSPERLQKMLEAVGSLERLLASASGGPPPLPPGLVEEAGDAIRPLLGSRDAAVRNQAGWTLARIGDAQASPFLLQELEHGRAESKRRAARYLGLLGDRAAAGPLRAYLSAARTDADRREAAMALGRLGDTAGLDVLCAIIAEGIRGNDRENVQSAIRTVKIIGALKDRRATEPLCAALLKKHWFRDSWYGAAIVSALGEIGDLSARPVLEEIQRTTNFDPCRNAAEKALASIGAGKP